MKRAIAIVFTLLCALAGVPDAGAQTLRVMTYNAGLLRALGSDYVPLVDLRAQRAPEVVADVVSRHEPDLLLLEEIWNPKHAQAVRAALEPLGYTVLRPTARSVLLGLTSGLILAVRSPLEVEDWSFRRFAANTFIENFARKGVLEAVVRAPDGTRIAVVGTHTVALDTVAGAPSEPGQVRVFRRQATQVLAALAKRTEGGKLPAIVLGDFNVGPGYADPEYRILAAAPGVQEAGAAALPLDPLVTWDPENPLVRYGEYPNEPAAKIDHVFLADGTDLRWRALDVELVFREPVEGLSIENQATPLSDHYGLHAVVVLERN